MLALYERPNAPREGLEGSGHSGKPTDCKAANRGAHGEHRHKQLSGNSGVQLGCPGRPRTVRWIIWKMLPVAGCGRLLITDHGLRLVSMVGGLLAAAGHVSSAEGRRATAGTFFMMSLGSALTVVNALTCIWLGLSRGRGHGFAAVAALHIWNEKRPVFYRRLQTTRSQCSRRC